MELTYDSSEKIEESGGVSTLLSNKFNLKR